MTVQFSRPTYTPRFCQHYQSWGAPPRDRVPYSVIVRGDVALMALTGMGKDNVAACPCDATFKAPIVPVNAIVEVTTVAAGQLVRVEQGRPGCGPRRAIVTVPVIATRAASWGCVASWANRPSRPMTPRAPASGGPQGASGHTIEGRRSG